MIRMLDRYLAHQVLLGSLVAAAALLGLFGFLDLVEHLENVGEGAFGVADAAQQMVLGLPRRLAQLLPFTALLGGVGALGGLAKHHEIVAMRAAGVSIGGLAAGVLLAGLALVALLGLLEQVVAPILDQHALMARNEALGNSDAASRDWWLRDGDLVLHISDMRHGREPLEVEIMEFGDDHSLKRFLYARWADVLDSDRWRLHQVTIKVFGRRPTVERKEVMDWRPPAKVADIARLQLSPESLGIVGLYRYIAHLDRTRRPATQYRLVFWQKLAGAVSVLAMTLLALAFVFCIPRGGLGARLLLGAVTGLVVFLVFQLAGSLALVAGVPPVLAALGPAGLLLLGALLLLHRQGRV